MAELPNLKAVYDELHPKGFEIIGISFDNDLAPLKSVVQQQRIPWPQFFEPGENRFGRMFDIDHFPSMWLVDQKGIIRFISAGEDLKGKVLKLMQESPTTPSTDPVPPPPKTPPASMRHLKLTGFSGNPEKPLVLLNSGTKTHTFGENDEQTLQTPGGELKVRCVKIHERSAKFIVGDGFELELKVY